MDFEGNAVAQWSDWDTCKSTSRRGLLEEVRLALRCEGRSQQREQNVHLPGEGKCLLTQGKRGRPVWLQHLGRREWREKERQWAGPGWVALADFLAVCVSIPNAMRRHCEVIREGEGYDLSYIYHNCVA